MLEEMFFRGMFLPQLVSTIDALGAGMALSWSLAVSIQALWFGLNHDNLLLLRITRSTIYGLVCYTSNNMWPAVMCHVCNNLMAHILEAG